MPWGDISVLLKVFRAGISDSIFVDRKQAITLRQAWTVINFAYSSLSSTLLKTQSCSACMCDNIASNGFLGVRIKHCTGPAVNLSDHLICDHNSNAKFICKALQSSHKLGKMSLSRGELTSAHEIGSVKRSSTIDNQKREPCFAHHL